MEPQSPHQFFTFNTSRQERIYRRLKLVGVGTPDYFKDACRLLEAKPSYETTTHLIGHLMREIESSIRSVLLVFADSDDRPEKASHIWEIGQILEGLGVPAEDHIGLLWLKHAPSLAHGRAHRDNLLPPRPVNEDFLRYVDEMESVFDFILDKFESKYLNIYAALDTKLQIENPANVDAAWIKVNVPNNEASLGYFFNRLTNPKWLAPLNSSGLFKRPPEPIYDREKSIVTFPPWPLSRYLVRMAGLNSAEISAEIGAILLEIESENFIVHLDIVDATCLLPIDLAVPVAEKERRWLQSQNSIGHLIPDKFANLTVHLANSGNPETALTIVSEMLDVNVIETEEQTAAEKYFGPEPQARMGHWDYEQFIGKCWKSLAYSNWKGSLTVFCGLLDKFLGLKYSGRGEGESNSYIWHRDVESDSDGIPNLFISAIRNIANYALSVKNVPLIEIIEILESHRWDIFERIVFYLLKAYPNDAQQEIKKRLLSKDNFQRTDIYHEYVLLLSSFFNKLEEREQQTILDWIDSSAPAVEDIQKQRLELYGAEISIEDAEKSVRYHKLEWLEPLKDVLPEEWRAKYTAWVEELGRPDHPGYLISAPQISWGEPAQPISEVLSKFDSTEKIVSYLSKPASDIPEAPQDLSRELSQLVAHDLHRFAQDAQRFEGLDPIFVYSFLSGILSSIQSVPETAWQNLLHLMNWVMAQPAAEIDLENSNDKSRETNWIQTRRLIGDMMSSLLSKESQQLPLVLRNEVWSVVKALTDDPNPTPAYETRYGGNNMDPLMVSMNTIRGYAFHTLFKYINWCRQHLEEDREFESIPEVREVLESHLDPNVDNSLAIRAVYGSQLPWLATNAPLWVSEHLVKLFPVEAAKDDLRKSVWQTFVIYNRAWNNVLDLLKDEYEKAIDRLEEDSLYRSERSASNLAEHLIVFYLRGKIGLEEGGLLNKFYSRASDSLCSHVFWFLGKILREETLPQDMLDRVAHLAKARIAKGQPHPKEMAEFGWLFASAKFDPEWSLDRLRDALTITPISDPDHSVIETLSLLAATHPKRVIECLSLLIDGADTEWKIDYWSPQIRTALASTLEKGEIESSTALINKLAARGVVSFRDLLR